MSRPKVYTEHLELSLSRREFSLLERARRALEQETGHRWQRRHVIAQALEALVKLGSARWQTREATLLAASAKDRALQVQLQERVAVLYHALNIQEPSDEALWLRDGCSHEPPCPTYAVHQERLSESQTPSPSVDSPTKRHHET